MSENIKFAISLAIGIAVFICSWILITKMEKSRKNFFMEKCKNAGYMTEGVSVNQKINIGTNNTRDPSYIDNNKLAVTYEYIVNGVKYHKKIKYQSPGSISVDAPQKVIVYYNPKDPKRAFCHEEHKGNNGCGVAIILFFITVFVVYNFLKFFVR